MNRKLLNGLLVLAVAAGGVGTFTSCKDENFSDNVRLDQASLQAQIDAIRGLTDAEFYANLDDFVKERLAPYATKQELADAKADLQKQINDLDAAYKAGDAALQKQIDDLKKKLDEIKQCQCQIETIEDIWKKIKENKYDEVKEYVEALYNMLFENIFPGEEWFQQIWANQNNIDNLYGRVSDINVDRVYNPVFGSINLPVGINSTVLASYMYKSTQGAYAFPGDFAKGHQNPGSALYDVDGQFQELIASLAGESSVELPGIDEVAFPEATQFGNMGGAILTINPSNLDFCDYTVELVNSKGETVLGGELGGLELTHFDDVLYFGGSRADGDESNGIYALNASVYPDTEAWKSLGIDINDADKSTIKDALKQVKDNKNLSAVSHLGEAVFNAVKDKLPAYAVKVSWEEEKETVVADPENEGKYITETEKYTNSVLTSFDLAAAVVHPLSYNTVSELGNYIPDRRLPIIHSTLSEILDRIKNKIDIKIELEDPTITPVDFEIQFYIEVQNGHSKGKIVPFYLNEAGEKQTFKDENGDVISFNYSNKGLTDIDLEGLVQAVLDAAALEMNTSLSSTVNEQVIAQLQDAISDINTQIKQQIEAQVGDFTSLIEDLQNSKKLTYGQKVLDLYNRLAEKANYFLDNVAQYAQVTMAYSTGDGLHHLSNDIYMPNTVNPAKGNTLELYATSYTGDVLVPAYKKYVAITGIVNADKTVDALDPSYLKQLNNNASVEDANYALNQVFDGAQQKTVLNVAGLPAGTYRLTYIAVDYRGMCSADNYYIEVLGQ
ncbi:MAG: hypothetical protein J1E16_07835 [Muribaculaceae bacterium]|nr:hypothetical protein [Muribaculaceae bacterium]